MSNRFDALIFRLERLERIAALRQRRGGEASREVDGVGEGTPYSDEDRRDARREANGARARFARRIA